MAPADCGGYQATERFHGRSVAIGGGFDQFAGGTAEGNGAGAYGDVGRLVGGFDRGVALHWCKTQTVALLIGAVQLVTQSGTRGRVPR